MSKEIREDLRTFYEYAQQQYRTSQLMVLTDQDYLAVLERIKYDSPEVDEMEKEESHFYGELI